MLTIKKYHMKLAVLTYSVLLLISCGNTTKEKTQNTSQNKTAIIETEVKTNHSNTKIIDSSNFCLLYTSPSPRDLSTSRMPSSA